MELGKVKQNKYNNNNPLPPLFPFPFLFPPFLFLCSFLPLFSPFPFLLLSLSRARCARTRLGQVRSGRVGSGSGWVRSGRAGPGRSRPENLHVTGYGHPRRVSRAPTPPPMNMITFARGVTRLAHHPSTAQHSTSQHSTAQRTRTRAGAGTRAPARPRAAR